MSYEIVITETVSFDEKEQEEANIRTLAAYGSQVMASTTKTKEVYKQEFDDLNIGQVVTFLNEENLLQTNI